jgi:hypothetical protein
VVVRRIGAFSLGKVMGILYALLGLIFGVGSTGERNGLCQCSSRGAVA